jgi:hypothetical protein
MAQREIEALISRQCTPYTCRMWKDQLNNAGRVTSKSAPSHILGETSGPTYHANRRRIASQANASNRLQKKAMNMARGPVEKSGARHQRTVLRHEWLVPSHFMWSDRHACTRCHRQCLRAKHLILRRMRARLVDVGSLGWNAQERTS